MKANGMEPGTWDDGREALQEFQRGHDEIGGAIAVRGFQLQHDLTALVWLSCLWPKAGRVMSRQRRSRFCR